MDRLKEDVLNRIDVDGMVSLTSEAVKIPSITGDEAEVAFLFQRRMKNLGLDAEIYEVRGHNVPPPGRASVVCRVKGSGGGCSLMFLGHLDTEPVPPGYDEIEEAPFSGRIADGFIFGIGTVNMKASISAYIYVVKALLDAGVKPKGDIYICGVASEMDRCLGTHHLIARGLIPDMIIMGDPTEKKIVTAHTGSMDFTIRLKGKPTHACFADMGLSVAPSLARLIDHLYRKNFSYNEEKFKGCLEPMKIISYVNGGYEYRGGLFLDEVSLGLNMRMPPGFSFQVLEEELNEVLTEVKKLEPGIKTQLLPLNPMSPAFPPFEVSKDEYVVDAVRRAHGEIFGKDPEIGAVPPHNYGGTDAGVMRDEKGVPAAIYGPGGGGELGGSFSPPERIKIDDLADVAKVYALTALDICTRDRSDIEPKLRLPV
jgi:acetylornithine deacetylase/succinyl-diaminopimelate desuccinylase-like protein